MKINILILFFLFNLSLHAQEYKQAIVKKILTTNKIILESQKSVDTVVFDDSMSLKKSDKNYDEGIEYLKNNVLEKEILYVIENKNEKIIEVSIIYNCIKNANVDNNEMPCLNANFLNLELIRKGYIIYVGDNKFLKKNKINSN